mmetsp:Transcript_24615/g.35302  ORF Transcript_24615/g.35302 Transcript_24615/m.35302 type:complete len:272 (-) Transcript_24615:66-881(-)
MYKMTNAKSHQIFLRETRAIDDAKEIMLIDDDWSETKDMFLLHVACAGRYSLLFIQLLVEAFPKDCIIRDGNGMIPLDYAESDDLVDCEVVSLLMEIEAQENSKIKDSKDIQDNDMPTTVNPSQVFIPHFLPKTNDTDVAEMKPGILFESIESEMTEILASVKRVKSEIDDIKNTLGSLQLANTSIPTNMWRSADDADSVESVLSEKSQPKVIFYPQQNKTATKPILNTGEAQAEVIIGEESKPFALKSIKQSFRIVNFAMKRPKKWKRIR